MCSSLLVILKAAVYEKGGEGPLGFSRQGQPDLYHNESPRRVGVGRCV